MFDYWKSSIATYFIKRKYLGIVTGTMSYNSFFTSAEKLLILVPEKMSSEGFGKIANFLEKSGKKYELVVDNKRVEEFAQYHSQIIAINEDERNWLKLPKKSLREKISSKDFDIVIDLEIEENLLYSTLSNLATTKVKVGFKKENSDLYYNFQILPEINSEISYGNLLNSLQMF